MDTLYKVAHKIPVTFKRLVLIYLFIYSLNNCLAFDSILCNTISVNTDLWHGNWNGSLSMSALQDLLPGHLIPVLGMSRCLHGIRT